MLGLTTEREKVEEILAELPESYVLILKEILQAEKELLHRKALQGSAIVNDIVQIVKERVAE